MIHRSTQENTVNLDDMTSLLHYLQQNQDENGRGQLTLPGLGISVEYDLYDGKIGPINFIQTGEIEVLYSKEVEHALTQQLTDKLQQALIILAKLYLLERLIELGDERINKIIRSRHGVQ